MRRGEVWWVKFDPSVGSEIRKTRPAVIISNNDAIRHLSRVVVVPTTSVVKRLYPGEAIVEFGGRQSKIKANQLTTVSKLRMSTKIDRLSPEDMRAVEHAVRMELGLTLSQ